MDNQNKKWNPENPGSTFIPGCPEEVLVAATVKRIGQLVDISGKEETLSQIITISFLEAQEIQVNRATERGSERGL
jgi:hypothetical protein